MIKKTILILIFLMGLVFVVNSHKLANHRIENNLEITATSNTKPSLKVAIQSQDLEPVKDKNSTLGLQLHLLDQFATQHDFTIEFTANLEENWIFEQLEQGLIDIAVVNQPVRDDTILSITRSPDIINIHAQVIYRRGSFRPKSFDEINQSPLVILNNHRGQKQAQFLAEHYPEMKIELSQNTAQDILEKVHRGQIAFALLDSDFFIHHRSKFPRAKVAFDAFYPESINWLISGHKDDHFIDKIDHFFNESITKNKLNHIKELYFGHINEDQPISSRTFFSRIEKRLPQYQDLIEQIAADFDMDWRLLAAIAYQESHWNPIAKSPTGVRGMMMLTRVTAKEMGVTNRLDPAASLTGGAQYFWEIHQRINAEIKEPDRTWFALAAYNIGFGHLQDAREITRFHSADPNKWADVKKYLPLLEKEAWYQYTRYGKARGNEPVQYVQNIRHFRDLLEWHFPLTQYEKTSFGYHNSAFEIDNDTDEPSLTQSSNNNDDPS